MKKLFFIMMLFISINTSSQNYEIYECTKTGMSESRVNKWETNDVSFIIRINTDKGIIEFDNADESRLYLGLKTTQKKMTDDEGDIYLLTIYTAYDKKGLKCEFRSFDYLYLSNRNFMLIYDDYMFFYVCKILNLDKNESNQQIL